MGNAGSFTEWPSVAAADGNRVIIKNGPARLTMNVPPDAPVEIAIQRDHPVPLVSVTTKSEQKSHRLEFRCKIET